MGVLPGVGYVLMHAHNRYAQLNRCAHCLSHRSLYCTAVRTTHRVLTAPARLPQVEVGSWISGRPLDS